MDSSPLLMLSPGCLVSTLLQLGYELSRQDVPKVSSSCRDIAAIDPRAALMLHIHDSW